MVKYICWEPQYTFEKIFILTTRWQLLHLSNFTLDERLSMSNLFIPDQIKKIRNIRSIASYEIIWKKEYSVIEMLKEYKEKIEPSDNNDVEDSLLTSIEPQDLVLNCYPELVEAFESTRNVKTKKRTANSRRRNITTNTEENIGATNIAKSRQKITKKKTENNRKIEDFISRNHTESLEESFESMTITPKRSKEENTSSNVNKLKIKNMPENAMDVKQVKRGLQFNRVLEMDKIDSKLNNTIDRMFNELSPDDFTSENEDSDLNVTNIIDNICSKRIFQLSVRNRQSMESTNQENVDNVPEYKIGEFKSLIKEKFVCAEDEKQELDDSDDEFGGISELYVPINQRIQKKENKLLCNQIKHKSSVAFENIMDETDESAHLDI